MEELQGRSCEQNRLYMSFGGVNYVNNANKNGDVRGTQLVYVEKAV